MNCRSGVAPLRDGLALSLLGALLRVALVLAYGRNVPAADDGQYYQVVAERIAAGQGYTWAWPDGVVTFAAHYPVGYAGLLGAAYAVGGGSIVVAQLVNALLGAVAVFGTHRLAARGSGRLGALLAAGFVALSPTLVGYTLALMTEGAVAMGWVVATWLAVRIGEGRGAVHHRDEARRAQSRVFEKVALVLVLGATTLVRPQSLLLAPVLGFIAGAPGARVAAGSGVGIRALWARLGRVRGAVLVTALAVAVCVPWTARNCVKMERCVFVSANGGWNLLIGTFPEGEGSFVPISGERVPEECREVFAEAAKDACFGAAGQRRIAAAPLRWLGLVPSKLASTFDFTASASAYLASAGTALSPDAHSLLTKAEIGARRVLVAAALLGAWQMGRRGAARARGQSGGASGRWLPRVRAGLLVFGVSCLFFTAAWLSHVAFVLLAATARDLAQRPVLLAAAGAVAATLVVHAVFFGAGRYSMVLEPLLAAVAASVVCLGPAKAGSAESPRGSVFDTAT